MGVFGAVFGCSGDAGFSGALLGVCSGVVGFNVAMVSCLVRDNVRPARSKWPHFSVFALAGRVFSRRCRWRGCAGRASSRQLALRWSWMRCGALQGGCGWGGGCAMRSPLAACRRRVGGLDGVIPPCGGEAALLDANRPIVHVIPLSLFQDLNWCRLNCNDSGDY